MRQELTEERREKLAQLLIINGFIQATDMARRFNVSTETIRKDIISLEQKGVAKKSHGGAVVIKEFLERPFSRRELEYREEKQRIAARAMDFVPQKGIIILDAGSTVHSMAKHLIYQKDLTIITNSLSVAHFLADSENKIYVVGGEVRNVTMSLVGYWANNAFKSIKADVAFLGTSGFMSHKGPCAESFIEAEMKESIIECSRKKIVLADHSKFVSDALVEYIEWKKIDCLITDQVPDKNWIDINNDETELVIA
ncbi:MAG: DeoR/GlpR family DNA-binding transcription regulator [Treponema sp.]|jgi:DeoR/GlpR family transcriptional regulator of sugar metabolism|nr:DeoR/GlpR family DNA-binding transcription regulator [Treponema sp.]